MKLTKENLERLQARITELSEHNRWLTDRLASSIETVEGNIPVGYGEDAIDRLTQLVQMRDQRIEELEAQVNELNQCMRDAGWGQGEINSYYSLIEDKDERIAELAREVEFLRRYGNKDCTAQADAAMEGEG